MYKKERVQIPTSTYFCTYLGHTLNISVQKWGLSGWKSGE